MPFLKLGQTVYHDPWPPARMALVSAAALSTTLPLAEVEANVRRRNAARLQRALAAVPTFTTITHPDASEPGYLRLPVIASDRGRDALSGATARRLGVMPGYPKPLCDLDVLRPRLANPIESFPGASRLARTLLTLPTHSLLSETDLVDLETLVHGTRRT
jgi:dTDP-4-amino-4,6-dideoxygalactose transaminase